jgi:hypothetical protein
MSELDRIVDVTISRDTQSVSRAGFGIPAIMSEFSTAKTTEIFDRHRFYANIQEMTDDGWLSTDREYKAAQIIFSQNPKVEKLMIGRKDSGDADWTTALGLIKSANDDWYTFGIIGTKTMEIVFDSDFVTGNLIDITLNGTVVTQVPFNSDQATTMSDLETQIETDVTNSAVTVVAPRTLQIVITDNTPFLNSLTVTGGASQTDYTVSFDDTGLNDIYKEGALWSESNKKLFFFSTSDADTITSATSDIISFMKDQNYDRTVSLYHPNSQTEETPAWLEFGEPGEALPFDPGSQTWKFKTIRAVSAYTLTSSELNNLLGKNGNAYSADVGGKDMIEEGHVASGEWIDIIRGLDKSESRLKENVFALLSSDATRKVPYTDAGVQSVTGTVTASLNEDADDGIYVRDSIVVTAPKVEDVPQSDRANRLLPDVNFAATLQGAIHKVEINGVVTV